MSTACLPGCSANCAQRVSHGFQTLKCNATHNLRSATTVVVFQSPDHKNCFRKSVTSSLLLSLPKSSAKKLRKGRLLPRSELKSDRGGRFFVENAGNSSDLATSRAATDQTTTVEPSSANSISDVLPQGKESTPSVLSSAALSSNGFSGPVDGEMAEGAETLEFTEHFEGDRCEKMEKLQERMAKQLWLGGVVFLLLAGARVVDALPGIFSEDAEEQYPELITLFSALDPLLVGSLAFGTSEKLSDALERERKKLSTADMMRTEAMEDMLEFFKKANSVILGLACVSFLRLGIEVVIDISPGKLADNAVEMVDILTALTELVA
eukprot:TRINITY_DN5964_c0_g1_i2.p1 TRINITY_DN5964_c0_g1~~TRINITY_DN5964_c0_g1_i2.p1  ORF type:complete len:323 (-),score=62.76 TRINITY_DN5964_c0_g1_i2:209-1177(-)